MRVQLSVFRETLGLAQFSHSMAMHRSQSGNKGRANTSTGCIARRACPPELHRDVPVGLIGSCRTLRRGRGGNDTHRDCLFRRSAVRSPRGTRASAAQHSSNVMRRFSPPHTQARSPSGPSFTRLEWPHGHRNDRPRRPLQTGRRTQMSWMEPIRVSRIGTHQDK